MSKINSIAGFFVGLIAEKKDGKWRASVGRFAFWSAFIPALYIWGQAGIDIEPNHQMILLALLTYNIGKHGLSSFGKKSEESG